MNKQKGFVTILAIIIGLLVVGGGAYYLKVNNEKKLFSQIDSENIDISDNSSEKSINLEEDAKFDPQVAPLKQQDKATVVEKVPEKSKDAATTTTTNMINTNISTSNNLTDFVNNLKVCKETKFNRSVTADFLGNNVVTDVSYEIANDSNKCLLNVTLNKIELSLGDELSKSVGQPNTQFINVDGSELDIEKFYKDLNNSYSSMIGVSGYCDIEKSKEDLLELFSKKPGDFMYGDIALIMGGEDVCGGKLFEIAKNIANN